MEQTPQNTPDPIVDEQQKQETIQKLHKVAKSSQEVLARATSVFPIDLFPSTIAIDRTQISITKRRFIFAGDVTSIRIEDILNVTAQVGPFFGTVHITTRYFDTGMVHAVQRLWRDHALRIAAIINGLIVAKKNGLDITNLDRRALVETLVKVGQNPVDTQP